MICWPAVSNGANTITDTGGTNVVMVGGGANHIVLGDGNNSITTGNGANSITVGMGTNTISVGTGNDTIVAGNGANTITDTGGNNSITTGTGADTITVGNGNNLIMASDGANSVTVGDGNNTIFGGSGDDSFTGGNGNNTFMASLGNDVFSAGTGLNTVDFTPVAGVALAITLASGVGTATGAGVNDTLTNIHAIVGNDAGDTITGTGSDAYLFTGGSGNDSLTGGTGNNTIDGGSAGADSLYGGSGNNSFLSPHAGTYYNGTNGANLTAGQINSIDYSADSANLTINLASGTGIGGTADGSLYAFTPTNGYNSITKIIGGSGVNSISGSNSDDYLVAGTGSGTDSLSGGLGNNTLVGSTHGFTNYYMGGGHDTIIGNTGTYDRILYQGSPAGVVINLDSVDHTFTNSAGTVKTVAAYSGSNFGSSSADQNSYSTGDYFTPVSGNLTSISEIQGSSSADLIFGGADHVKYLNYSGGNDTAYGGSGGMDFYGYDQNDFFYGGSGADNYQFSRGNDRADGGTGLNVIRTYSFYASDYNVTTYLDGTADINGNGIAEYIDKKVNGNSLVSGGVTYSGFELGWGNATDGSSTYGSTLVKNFDNVIGNTANDFIVGNNNANQINARGGNNAVYGLGGNDIITAIEGNNYIDGGTGTDIVNFQYNDSAANGNDGFGTASTNNTYGVRVFFADATFSGTASDRSFYYGDTIHGGYQAQTGTSGQYSYDQIVNVENINGSDYNDVLYGNSSANVIYGNSGNDTIAGNGGADSVYGGAGNDLLLSTSANMASAAVFDGGAGTDTLQSAGWTFTANSFTSGKYNAIDVIDVRNSAAGGTYGLSNADIINISTHTSGTASLTLKLDTGDTFTATPAGGGQVVLQAGDTLGVGDNHYHYYANTGHTYTDAGFTSTLIVHYGAG